MPESSSSSSPSAAAVPFVHPLDDFYARASLRLPNMERITGEQVPEPYHSLLVHEHDMTPTLEKYHGSEIHLRIISRVLRDDFYFREVVLELNGTNVPVEFGANKVNLTLLPPRARHLVLEEKIPLGRILNDFAVEHTTHPKAFFRVSADDLIRKALGLAGPEELYGRRANILDAQKRPLSEIVEILPPTARR